MVHAHDAHYVSSHHVLGRSDAAPLQRSLGRIGVIWAFAAWGLAYVVSALATKNAAGPYTGNNWHETILVLYVGIPFFLFVFVASLMLTRERRWVRETALVPGAIVAFELCAGQFQRTSSDPTAEPMSWWQLLTAVPTVALCPAMVVVTVWGDRPAWLRG